MNVSFIKKNYLSLPTKNIKNTDKNNSIDFSNILIQNQIKQVSNLDNPVITNADNISMPVPASTSLFDSLKYSSNQAYGYTVDKAGFMGADFNKAAGLPQDFKIHKSTLDAMIKFNTQEYNKVTYFFTKGKGNPAPNMFEKIDIANTIKQYYNIFSQVTAGVVNDGKEYYSSADLAQLPRGYMSKDGLSDHDKYMLNPSGKGEATNWLTDRNNEKVLNLLRTDDDVNKIYNIYKELSPNVIVDYKILDMQQMMDEEYTGGDTMFNSFKPDMSVYKNENGYTKGQLFVAFLKSEGGEILDGGTTKIKEQYIEEGYNSLYLTYNSMKETARPMGTYFDLISGKISTYDVMMQIRKNLNYTLEHIIDPSDMLLQEFADAKDKDVMIQSSILSTKLREFDNETSILKA